VQEHLRRWVGRPEAIRKGEPSAIAGLIEGLLMTGFAMQWSRSSRPASGAEHQFSHLWDMQSHRHDGHVPLHGCKVGIGTLAVALLYEAILGHNIESLDVGRACAQWPDLADVGALVHRTHTSSDLRTLALQEMTAKHVGVDDLASQLERLKVIWPTLAERLRKQLIPAKEVRQMLRAAGAPHEPSQIGIDLPRLRRSYLEAQQIRRRYTVLDLAAQTGLMPQCLEALFAGNGPWSEPDKA
jgi:glycerol-1-phosphate dehydrogenase [NAD(P)+]